MASIVIYLELPVVVPLDEGKQEHTKIKLLPQQVVAYHPFGELLSIYLSSGLMFYISMTMEEYEAAVNSYYKQVAAHIQGAEKTRELKNSIKIVN